MDGCLCIMYFHLLGEVDNQRLLLHQLSFIKKNRSRRHFEDVPYFETDKAFKKIFWATFKYTRNNCNICSSSLEWDLCYAKKLYSSCRVPGIWDNGQCF